MLNKQLYNELNKALSRSFMKLLIELYDGEGLIELLVKLLNEA